jgi:hypothetical protein
MHRINIFNRGKLFLVGVSQYLFKRLYFSDSCLPNSHRDGLGSIPGPIVLIALWTEWLWGKISASISVSPVSFHSLIILSSIIYIPDTDS